MMVQTLMEQKNLSKYCLAKALDVSMEVLLRPCFAQRIDFELFKSNVCHHWGKCTGYSFCAESEESERPGMKKAE